MKKAVFLDRDGVVNRERGDYTWLLEDFVLNEGVIEAMLDFQKRGYLLFIISNQGGVGKGMYTIPDVEFLHHNLRRTLANSGVEITEIYFCPHHPATSNCICRKPDSLLLEKATARFGIDPQQSYFIGDAERDEEAGKKAGVQTIRVESNTSLLNILSLVK